LELFTARLLQFAGVLRQIMPAVGWDLAAPAITHRILPEDFFRDTRPCVEVLGIIDNTCG